MIATSIKDFLVDEGIGTFGTDLFVSSMPDGPDDAICVFDEPGFVATEHLRYDLDNFGFEIMVRGSYSYCKSTMTAIHKVVPQLTGTYDSIYIKETFTQTNPAIIETDDKGRRVYTAHYESEVSLGATSRTSVT